MWKADIFIIPNKATLANEEYQLPYETEDGVKAFEGEMVQVSITSPESANWGCHGYPSDFQINIPQPKYPGGKRVEYAPDYFPVSLFEGKVEGDTVQVYLQGNLVELKLNQLSYRSYRYNGLRFEEVLAKVKL